MSQRIIYYAQTQFQNPCNGEGYYSLAPIAKTLNPVSHRPYATHVILAAFNMGPSASNPNQMQPYLHRNDLPLGSPLYNQVWTDVATLQSAGVPVMMMLGGAGAEAQGTNSCGIQYDNDTWNALARDFSTYYALLKSGIQTYKLAGIDLDVENAVELDLIVQLIRQLRSDFGPGFIITAAPVASALAGGGNLSGFSYVDLEQQAGADINWYNGQFYNGFGDPTLQDYQSIVTYQNGIFPPEKVVIGTASAAGQYPQLLSNIPQIMQQYPSFGGADLWEYYDAPPTPSQPVDWSIGVYTAMQSR